MQLDSVATISMRQHGTNYHGQELPVQGCDIRRGMRPRHVDNVSWAVDKFLIVLFLILANFYGH